MTPSPAEEAEAGEPPATSAPDVPASRMFRFALRTLSRHPFLLAASLLASIGIALADLVSLALVFPFIASLSGGAFPADSPLAPLGTLFEGMAIEEKVRLIALLLLGIQIARGALHFGESRVNAYLGLLFERDVRQLVFDDLLRVELRYLQKERSANILTIMHNYPRESARLVRDYLGGVARVVTGIGLVATLFVLSWQLTLLALGLGAISLLAIARLRRTIKRLGRETRDTRVALQQLSLESLQSMKAIRLFAREEHAKGRFLDQVKALQRQSYASGSLTAVAAPLQRILNMALFAGLLIAATFVLQQTGESWIVLLTLFLLVVMRLMGPLSNFASRSARIASETPALEAIIEFLDRPKPYLRDGDRPFEGLRQRIAFEDVTFAYDAGREPVLRDVSFEIPRGGTVAIVGGSGSGKSTLVQLLARLSDPTSGRIVVDGTDLRELRSASWRRRIAVVSQDIHLFSGSVRDNIRFGRLEASDEEVEQAARLAHAHEFILEMERGYDTLVGERGVRLSGGQAQRLAIARALLADPDVLVLDEATSALDTVTERGVQQAIEVASRGRTVLVIAHRLSTIRDASTILVLEAGRIVERGTHDELLARGGPYARLVALQDMRESPGGARPAPPLAPASAAPRAPARPLEAVLLLAQSRARVAFDDGSQRDVALHVGGEANGADGVFVRQGETVGLVRLAGVSHPSVPLYAEAADGKVIRVRVKSAQGAGSARVRMAD